MKIKFFLLSKIAFFPLSAKVQSITLSMFKLFLSILALILPLGATFAANPTTEELNLKTPTIKTQ